MKTRDFDGAKQFLASLTKDELEAKLFSVALLGISESDGTPTADELPDVLEYVLKEGNTPLTEIMSWYDE